MSFRKYHGITMSSNSWIENLNCERLAADPVPLTAGRLWFNETEKLLKYSSLDGVGAVVVKAFTSADEVATALADHTTTMQAAIDLEHDSINATIAALGNVFNYAGSVDGGIDSAAAYDLDLLPAADKEVGDYHNVTTAGYFKYNDGAPVEIFANLNDGLVKNNTGGWDIIDNTNAVSTGTAGEIDITGSLDTGFVVSISAAFTARIDSNDVDITALNAAIVAANTSIGTLANLTTTDKSNLVNAINEVQTEANANNAQIATNATAISTEAARAAAAEVANATAISAETTRATGAESTNATAIAAEETRALAAEAANAASAATNATDIGTETARAIAAEAGLATDIGDEETRALAAEAANAAAITAEAGARATADGILQDNIDDLAVLAGTGTDALRDKVNAQRAIYTAPSAQLSHTFNHGLVGENLSVEVWAKDGLKWYNDSALVEMDPATTSVTVPLQVAAVIKIIVEDKTAIV